MANFALKERISNELQPLLPQVKPNERSFASSLRQVLYEQTARSLHTGRFRLAFSLGLTLGVVLNPGIVEGSSAHQDAFADKARLISLINTRMITLETIEGSTLC